MIWIFDAVGGENIKIDISGNFKFGTAIELSHLELDTYYVFICA